MAFDVVSSISVAADDCYAVAGAAGHSDLEYLSCIPYVTSGNDDTDVYLRFQIPEINRGAKIISATLTIKAYNTFAGDYLHNLQIENTANSAAFSDAEVLSSRTWISVLGGIFDDEEVFTVSSWSANDVLVTYNFALSGAYYLGEGNHGLQSVLADNAWVANNYISLRLMSGLWVKDEPASNFYAKEYDDAHATTYRAQLDITYINRTYSRGDELTLPANTTDLENLLTSLEYTNVETIDGTYTTQVATKSSQPFGIFLFKDQDTVGQSYNFSVTWNGRVSEPGTAATIYLQIYDYNSAAWVTLASNNTVAGNTDFTLTGSVTSNPSYYYSGGYIAARVYQEAKT